MRLVSRLAPPAAIVALALAITAAPASAEQRDACSDARKQVAASINELHFYSALGGSLAFFGLHSDQVTWDAAGAKGSGTAAAETMGTSC
jgi:hypothetical protein